MNKVNFEKYRFEVMLIVIVVVLLIFWMMINYFENKNKNNNANFAPINSNIVNETAGLNNYNIESFENEEPTGHNTEAIEQKNITQNRDYAIAAGKEPSTINNSNNDNNNNDNANNNNNNNNNDFEKTLNVDVNNSKIVPKQGVPSFYSLNMEQLSSLKKQTRQYGALGLVFYDEKTDTLRIESTKS
jgi:hypothetical protein